MRVEHRLTCDERLNEATEVCARQGAQLTCLRRRVFELVVTAEAPSTAYQLLDRLKTTRKGAVPPTIYRALEFLIEQRLVHKIECLNAFVPCAEAGRGHQRPVQFLICRQCGAVTEIGDQAVARALADAARREGFHPGKAVVELDGTCATCSHSS